MLRGSPERGRCWDGLMLGFTASLMLCKDLPAVEAIIVLVVLLGAALALGDGE
jgi:hypothetical protein